MKHCSGAKCYLRYADDFIILDYSRENLENLVDQIEFFVQCQLALKLHPDKIIIRKLSRGIDFLGYVVLPYCRTLRTKTKKRMIKRLNSNNLPSYLGLLEHCNGYKLEQRITKFVY